MTKMLVWKVNHLGGSVHSLRGGVGLGVYWPWLWGWRWWFSRTISRLDVVADWMIIGTPVCEIAVRGLREFEPESVCDWLLIPWWLARYAFAWCWSIPWYGALRFNIWLSRDKPSRGWRHFPGPTGRHNQPDPVICPRCLWAGPVRWLVHTYGDDGSGMDVEPVDECPRCGKEL